MFIVPATKSSNGIGRTSTRIDKEKNPNSKAPKTSVSGSSTCSKGGQSTSKVDASPKAIAPPHRVHGVDNTYTGPMFRCIDGHDEAGNEVSIYFFIFFSNN